MSVSQRLFRLVRANLSPLIDKAVGTARGMAPPIEELSDEALEAELSRRRQRRRGAAQAASHARHRAYRAPRAHDRRLARLYAQLECPYGADLNTVRKQYRQLMRRYHPDMHARDNDKQQLATELSQRLTAAYNELRVALRGS